MDLCIFRPAVILKIDIIFILIQFVSSFNFASFLRSLHSYSDNFLLISVCHSLQQIIMHSTGSNALNYLNALKLWFVCLQNGEFDVLHFRGSVQHSLCTVCSGKFTWMHISVSCFQLVQKTTVNLQPSFVCLIDQALKAIRFRYFRRHGSICRSPDVSYSSPPLLGRLFNHITCHPLLVCSSALPPCFCASDSQICYKVAPDIASVIPYVKKHQFSKAMKHNALKHT